MTVLRELFRDQRPPSHAELAAKICGFGLNRATVYRVLHVLTDAGLLVRMAIGDHVWRFKLVDHHKGDCSHHPHFVCGECGAVACLPSDSVLVRSGAEELEIADIQLRGRCAPCGQQRVIR